MLLAADFGLRSRGRRQLALIGLTGIGLPIFGTTVLVGAIGVATGASSFYVPSLNPNIGMALWSHAAGSAMPGRLMIALITIFGAIRFGVRALVRTAAIRIPGTRKEWTLLACFVVAAAWLSLHPFDPIGSRRFTSPPDASWSPALYLPGTI